MKTALFLVFALAFIAVEGKMSRACSKPGQTVLAPDGCNHCRCSEKGILMACTKMMCPPRTIEKSCKPGTTFKHKDGCNTCKCSDDGKNALCTSKLCL
uniref:U-reduvitoxin-Pr11a n=1 Tax=Platymeris rhadamanthus TaxID=1134088 RepID=PI11A_PLARH|nr:RecName: Full=U-reduvitoxin-Pr11a; Short=U-RDTX-Pr11a; AltName: Full=Venom pacifastin domain peptide Pr11a; Contains: RecName: Full=U-reduvitoxin-Pr11a.1; Short=U-RDTX-Pr11a.1; Contains: RecName: Full=U-reduvitoxin-Pr11a.2; Short=U-RDTX-Pr11a.2; Flags: Precursor [Platymeris rhadamanthus]QHB21531.1 venom pacifastin domain peptide Pr11a [Platymeris rhadamanthus]